VPGLAGLPVPPGEGAFPDTDFPITDLHKVGAAAHDVAWPPAPTGSTNTQIRYLFIRGS
jgi:hypothetical protein